MNTQTVRHIPAGRPVREDFAKRRHDELRDEQSRTSKDNVPMLLAAFVVLLPIGLVAMGFLVRFLLSPT